MLEENGDASCQDTNDMKAALTSRVCSSRLRSGFTSGGAATSQTLILPSPQADARMFSFSCSKTKACHETQKLKH